MYIDSNTLQDVNSQTTVDPASPVLNTSNYNTENQISANSGVCIAIDRNGSLLRRPCSDVLQALCSNSITREWRGRERERERREVMKFFASCVVLTSVSCLALKCCM